jgi:hypothetical protein
VIDDIVPANKFAAAYKLKKIGNGTRVKQTSVAFYRPDIQNSIANKYQ